MAVYYFSGKENYLKKEELKKIIAKTECPQINVSNFYEYSPEIYDFIYTAPFVGDKKICIIHFIPDQEDLIKALKDLPDFVNLYIVTSEFLDQRKKVIKEFLNLATEKKFEKISESLLYKCIAKRLLRFGYHTEEIESVKSILIECFHSYTVSLEMTLDEVIKHVDMIGFSGNLSPDNIRMFSPESSDYRAFRLSNMLLSQDSNCIEFSNQLLLHGDNAIGLLSLIAYQVRVCYKASLFSDENYLSLIGIRNYQLYKNFFDYPVDIYRRIYSVLMESIRRIKLGENSETVMAECLTQSLTVLKEKNYV